jgi:hypothetical protein
MGVGVRVGVGLGVLVSVGEILGVCSGGTSVGVIAVDVVTARDGTTEGISVGAEVVTAEEEATGVGPEVATGGEGTGV